LFIAFPLILNLSRSSVLESMAMASFVSWLFAISSVLFLSDPTSATYMESTMLYFFFKSSMYSGGGSWPLLASLYFCFVLSRSVEGISAVLIPLFLLSACLSPIYSCSFFEIPVCTFFSLSCIYVSFSSAFLYCASTDFFFSSLRVVSFFSC